MVLPKPLTSGLPPCPGAYFVSLCGGVSGLRRPGHCLLLKLPFQNAKPSFSGSSSVSDTSKCCPYYGERHKAPAPT